MFGIILYIFYLVIGILVSDVILYQKRPLIKLWVGLVTGTVLLMWSNVPFSFVFGFSISSHLLGAAFSLLITFLLFFIKSRKDMNFRVKEYIKAFQKRWFLPLEKSEKVYLIILSVFMVYSLIVLWNHTIYELDGALWTGQSTYGDMSMHLGFITSIATQGTFPPEYNILPGTKLNYPFLCDSVSSSLYLFGSSLRASYIVPILVAFVTVFSGFWFLAMSILKKISKAAIAFMLFFLNGGFGIIYFLDNLRINKSNFTRIFTNFYETPTNLVNRVDSFSNIRWTNTIIDMMVPQRATLFGWMILFVVLYFLYMAVFEKKKEFFLPAGIFAGLIPMIHTHSYLACGLVAIAWIVVSLIKEKYSREILFSWLWFGIPALLISFPQLLIWTFDAALDNDGFFRQVFNWVNETDSWLWYGTGYQERENLLYSMFTDIDSFELYKAEYNIDYVFISSYERGNYPDIIIDYFNPLHKKSPTSELPCSL